MYKRSLRHYVLQIIHIENGFPMFMKCVVFYISVCSEAFVYCFAGEYLNIKVIKQCTEIPNRSISGYAITTDSVTKWQLTLWSMLDDTFIIHNTISFL